MTELSCTDGVPRRDRGKDIAVSGVDLSPTSVGTGVARNIYSGCDLEVKKKPTGEPVG